MKPDSAETMPDDASSRTSNRSPIGFADAASDVEAILTALRKQLRMTLDRVLPSDYSARSLGRFLEVDRMTAWRCWTIAHVADPAQALRAMPGGRGWTRLLSRLAKRSATAAEIDAIRHEVARFESLLRRQSLDRSSLKAIAATAAGTEAERTQILAARRAASRGAASLYGVHAKALLVTVLLAPGGQRGTLDSATVAIIEDLRRLRPGAPWPIMQYAVTSGTARRRSRRSLMADESMPSLIREASTPGIMGCELTEHTDERGVTVVSLGDVRPTHSRGMRITAAESNHVGALGEAEIEPFDLSISFLFPADLAVIELLVHRSLARHTDPVGSLIGTPVGPHNFEYTRLASRLPLEASFRPCKCGVESPRLKAASDAYRVGLSKACSMLHGDVDDFDAFRIELPYPPAFAAASASVELRNPRNAPQGRRAGTAAKR